jgi:hypothetical protein
VGGGPPTLPIHYEMCIVFCDIAIRAAPDGGCLICARLPAA